MKPRRKSKLVRTSHKVVPEITANLNLFAPCSCKACKIRLDKGAVKPRIVLAKWATTPGWGRWDPVKEAYEIPGDSPPPIERTATQSAARLAALSKARAAKAAKSQTTE